MKLLIFTPIGGLDAEAVQSAFTQEWTDPLGILYYRDHPNGDGRRDILHAYEHGRALALAGGYDAMLTLESDMVVPVDVLGKLAEVDAPVVHALYVFREAGRTWNPLVGKRWPGKYLDEPALKRVMWGKVMPVLGVGFGCTLIRREALERIPFRLGQDAHCDWYFAEDCHAAGLKVMLNGAAVCGHKGRDGVIWWPDADGTARASKSTGGEVYAYTGQGAYVLGLPTRDMTPEEWAAQPAALRALAESQGVQKHITPGPDEWALDGRFEPCQK